MYDIMNVFTAIGIAVRDGPEEIIWLGRDHIILELMRQKRCARVDYAELSLLDLFPIDGCVSLSSLTSSFLMLFAAIRVDVIDLRKASSFFSRALGKYRTTLCKLYQISVILGVLNVVERDSLVCVIRMLPPFTELLLDQRFAIPNLLVNSGDTKFVEKRRAEFSKWAVPRKARNRGNDGWKRDQATQVG
jgi:hypothetical protein